MSDWPIRMMVYGAGEAVNGAGALASQIQRQITDLQRVCTNPVVAATTQLDASDVPTRRAVLDPRGLQPVESLPNLNVGDPANLLGFVQWSAAICPAARSILVLSGHGLSWQDSQADELLGRLGASRAPTAAPPKRDAVHHARLLFGKDANSEAAMTKAVLFDGHDRDYLSNAELGAVCARISTLLRRKVDVLVFDACLMSSMEILQELRGAVSTVVGSIDELSATGIDLAGPARKLTEAGGQVDPSAMARIIASEFRASYPFDSCVAVDLENPSWAAGLAAFQRFCQQFRAWIASNPANAEATVRALRSPAASLVKYASGSLADIGALAEAFAALPSLPQAIIGDLRAATAQLKSCVLARTVGSDYRDATGLSIFAPSSATAYASNRPDYMRLQFPALSGWSAVLDTLYSYASDSVRLVSAASRGVEASGDIEFVVSLRGLKMDLQSRQRLQQLVQRTVLAKLAEADVLIDTSIVPSAIGINIVRAPAMPSPPTIQPVPRPFDDFDDSFLRPALPPKEDDFTLRVVLHQIALDDSTKELIDAAIRTAVIREVVRVDYFAGARPIAPRLEDIADLTRLPGMIPGRPGTTLGLVADFSRLGKVE